MFITAEGVRRGKPDPEGYLLAAARLGVELAACVVIEDSPPGVAAGMRVIAVTTTHRPAALAGADEVIERLDELLKVLSGVPANRS